MLEKKEQITYKSKVLDKMAYTAERNRVVDLKSRLGLRLWANILQVLTFVHIKETN